MLLLLIFLAIITAPSSGQTYFEGSGDDCKALCRKTPGCSGYTYVGDENPKYCYLNSDQGFHYPVTIDPLFNDGYDPTKPIDKRLTIVKSTECSIISGPGQVGTNCTFPFEFGGTIYNGCALDPKTNERWCATSVGKNGKFQPLGYEGKGNYGICSESCPKYDHTEPSAECKKQGKRKRVRKSVTRLSQNEKSRLRNAFERAIANTTAWMNFPDIANFHGAPFDVCPERGSMGCCPHSNDGHQAQMDFLPWHRLYLAQLEEVLDPYLADTNIGLPYWDWNHDSSVPDLFDNIFLPIKDFTNEDYSWEHWERWDPEMLSVCENPDQTQHQSHVLRIRKEHYDEINRQHVQKVGKVGSFSNLLDETVKKALEKRDYLEFTKGIDGAHAAIHNNLKCTTAYATTTAYDPAFWLHHGFVDKIFADWQANPMNNLPTLDKERIMAPFGNPDYNKFDLTNISPTKSLDFESKLCYCYDCDQPKNFIGLNLPTRVGLTGEGKPKFTKVIRPPPPKPEIEKMNVTTPHPIRKECQDIEPPLVNSSGKVEIYVGLVVPNHLGGKSLNYRICFGNSTEDCKNGLVSLFGNPGTIHDKKLPISSCHFNVREVLVEDNTYKDEERWANIEILEGKNLIPKLTPPFVILRITNEESKEDLKFVQLQKGVKKEMYGDLLENYEEVKNYCDTIELDKNSSPRFLNLGGLDSCNLRNTCTTNFLDSYRE